MKDQRSPEVFASTKINGARVACKYQNQRAEGQHRTQGARPKQNCRGPPEEQPEPRQTKGQLDSRELKGQCPKFAQAKLTFLFCFLGLCWNPPDSLLECHGC